MKSQFHAIAVGAAERIRAWPGIPAEVGVCAYERGDGESEIERSVEVVGLAVIVLPFEPVHALDGSYPAFYDDAELIVHVVENPRANTTGVDGSYLRDQVALALGGTDLEGLLAAPLSEHRISRADDGDLTIREMTWKAAAQLTE